MAFSINASGEAEYTITGSNETFTTSEVTFENDNVSSYQSDYKEETTEIIGTYTAESEHGTFTWTTTTTISTYAGFPEIDYELTDKPKIVDEILDEPSFEIEEDDDNE